LIDGARAQGAEIVYTVIESLTKDGRDRSLDHKLSNIHVPRGSPLARVIDEVAPSRGRHCPAQNLVRRLQLDEYRLCAAQSWIENVIVGGFVTDQCVDMAIRDGADRGYYMVCAEDACAAYSTERHTGALRAFGGYCRVQSVDEILGDLFSTPR
jgi:nicotinamidase-related amidase